jgi:3-dehydroquinate synthase
LQPLGVLIDTAALTTLPDNEYRAGLAEVIKYGVILDIKLFDFLEAHAVAINERRQDLLTHVIARCCQLKADVVQNDELEENGLRAILNFGHTFGHAFESLSGYGTLLHGEAVAIGMLCAARLAKQLGRIDSEFVDRLRSLLLIYELPVNVPDIDPQLIVNAMAHDKKVQHGRLHFILPTRLGHVERVADIDTADVLAAIAD